MKTLLMAFVEASRTTWGEGERTVVVEVGAHAVDLAWLWLRT